MRSQTLLYTIATLLGGYNRTSTFGIGVTVTPDGDTALICDAGNPINPANNLIFLNINQPSAITEITAYSPLPFPGIGSPRIAVHPDGDTALITSHLSDYTIAIDLSSTPPALIEPVIETGEYPWGVLFRP